MKSSARQSLSAAPIRIHLRIEHPHLAPDAITKTLAISPEHTLESGRTATSSASQRVRTECYWIAPLVFTGLDEPWAHAGSPSVAALQTMPPEAVIGFALRQLQVHQDFFRRIADEGGSATLLITTDTLGSMTIHPSLARKLADTGLSLELDWSGGVE